MAWVVRELSVGPPSGVDPVGQMRLRIQNKQTNKQTSVSYCSYCSQRQRLEGGGDEERKCATGSTASGVSGRNGHRARTRVGTQVPRLGAEVSRGTPRVGVRGAAAQTANVRPATGSAIMEAPLNPGAAPVRTDFGVHAANIVSTFHCFQYH